MERNRHSALLAGFFLISLLLHLLGLYILTEHGFLRTPSPEKPMVVEIRPAEPPPSPEPRERELDLPAEPLQERPREEPANRLGPADRFVEKETAPEGDFPEDRQPAAPAPPAPPEKKVTEPAAPASPTPKIRKEPSPPAETPKAPEPRIAKPRDVPAPPPAETEKMPEKAPEPEISAEKPASEKSEPLPDLSTLIASADKAVENLADRNMGEWRRKYREDVEKGDTTWLDTEKDILISFFQRFRNNIYGVWDYPRSSVERREEGTSLLRVTINRDGSVKQVKLMESSGYDSLDREAIEAVKKGASYGPLPRAYTEETLSIYTFFNYNLSMSRVRGGYIH